VIGANSDSIRPPIPVESGHPLRKVYIFVAAWGASNYTYAEAFPSQSLTSWISGHVRAFEYFGGVPEALVPDYVPRNIIRYDPPRHASDMVKNIPQPLTDTLRGLAPKHLGETGIAVGETEAQILDRPNQILVLDVGFPEIPLPLSGRPAKLQKATLPAVPLLLFQIALNQGIRTVVFAGIFAEKPMMNTFGGMSLFEAHPAVFFQPLVYLRFPGIQFRNRFFFYPLPAVEILNPHVLGDGFAVKVQALGDLLRPQPPAAAVP
jgi:hypothetical protein